MTNRLYYTDPYLQAFDATVSSVDRDGDRLVVTLDRTAFYPTSGGQPFDTGTLGSLRVVEVFDRDDGSVGHVVEGGSAQRGDHVHGEIDWPRRFDHMQQHTGQHVLSAAFEHLFHVRTISFHLGADASTIDLAREVTAAEIAAAEGEANRVVWEDRPVDVRFASAEEAAGLPLRKEPKREGMLRLIEVERFDLSACGGTHVARTGAIGIISVGAWERFKGGQRIEFLCGGRALDRFRSLRDTVTASGRLLSVLPQELPGSIERLQLEAKQQKRVVAGLQSELARYRADELSEGATDISLKDAEDADRAARLVLRAIDADAAALKSLAMAVTAKNGHLVVLTSTSRPALVVVARSSDLAVSAQQLVAKLIAHFGGRGGGKGELAQGGGLDAEPDVILAAARTAVTSSRQN
jgi:alanyl-tRNA synthetase